MCGIQYRLKEKCKKTENSGLKNTNNRIKRINPDLRGKASHVITKKKSGLLLQSRLVIGRP